MTFSIGLHTLLHKLEWLEQGDFLSYNFNEIIKNISLGMHICYPQSNY